MEHSLESSFLCIHLYLDQQTNYIWVPQPDPIPFHCCPIWVGLYAAGTSVPAAKGPLWLSQGSILHSLATVNQWTGRGPNYHKSAWGWEGRGGWNRVGRGGIAQHGGKEGRSSPGRGILEVPILTTFPVQVPPCDLTCFPLQIISFQFPQSKEEWHLGL